MKIKRVVKHLLATRIQMKRAFPQSVRTGGADTGEVLETVGHIREGDTASWHAAWEATASRVLERAGRICDPRGRGQALLRAHNYLRTAEFFLGPADPKGQLTFRRNVDAFEAGLDARDRAAARNRRACRRAPRRRHEAGAAGSGPRASKCGKTSKGVGVNEARSRRSG